MTQDQPKQMRPSPCAIFIHHPGALAKIHLRLISRLTLHPPERQGMDRLQLAHEPLDRLITARKLMLADQILINALSRQTLLAPTLDLLFKWLTMALPSRRGRRFGPGGRNGCI